MRRLQVWISATHAFESPQQYTVSGNGDCRFAQQFRMPAMPLSSSDHIRAFIKSDRSAMWLWYGRACRLQWNGKQIFLCFTLPLPLFSSLVIIIIIVAREWVVLDSTAMTIRYQYLSKYFVFALVPMECRNNLQFTHDCHYPSQMNVRVQIGAGALSICQANDLMRRWWCLVNR